MTILVTNEGPIATVLLNRPEVHNAFDAAMIAELRDAFTALASDSSVRIVVLTGAGASFCAGGDLNWMRSSLDLSQAENIADAEALAAMFEAAWNLPKPLLGRINGTAIGGGAGLVACCDLAVAVETARFGFSEVKLGLLPAVIAQYVLPKIGLSHGRALFVSGERFTAERAFEIGLIHAVTGAEELNGAVNSLLNRLISSGPEAVAVTKRLIDVLWWEERATAQQAVIEAIAAARTGAEGQEGIRAFLEKRRPAWHKG